MNIKIIILLGFLFLSACNQQQDDTAAEESAPVSAPEEPAAAAPVALEETGPVYGITQLEGDLYLATSDAYNTLFLVTSEGIVLADPINLAFSEWLKNELAERFNASVRYVLYSHYHWDHASGGAAFADTAEFVGHENMLPGLALPMPANYVGADANGDNAIEVNEARGGLANHFARMDADGDGSITGAELNRDIIAPTITYTDEYTITLGGKEVRMIFAGAAHSDDSSIVLFPEQETAFGVDWLAIKSFPRQLYGSNLDAWVEITDRMMALNPKIVVPGHSSHGPVGDFQDLVDYAQLFKDMRDAVQTAIDNGVSKEELQNTISLSAYSEWLRYDESLPALTGDAYTLATQE